MRLSARDASLIAVATLGLAAGLYGLARGLREPAPPAPQDQADAAALYARYCAVCHGPTGRGDGPGAHVARQTLRDFSDPAAMREADDRYYFAIIQKGGSQLGRSNAMPAWGMKLSDDEIRALVRYIRGLARAADPAASPPRKDIP
jgi:mono/diheme cytochrome c family protein